MGFLTKAFTAGLGTPIAATGGSKILELFGGPASIAGPSVTPERSITLTAVWRCVNLLSNLRAFLPLKLYRIRDDGSKEEATDHYLSNLIRKPNSWQTSFALRQFWGMSQLLWGNEYGLIDWRNGKVNQILPLHPKRVQLFLDDNGTPVYRVELRNGTYAWLSRFEVYHVMLFSMDGYTGVSPIQACRESLGLAAAIEEWGARTMANSGIPSGILTLPQGLTKEQEAAIKAQWQEVYAGLANTGRTAVLRAGMKYEPIGLKPVDLEWMETRKFGIEEVCRIYGVPPELAQHTSPVTSWGTGVEQRFQAFLTTTLDPHLVAVEQGLERALLLDSEQGRYYLRHQRAAMLRTDLITRFNAYRVGRMSGFMTVNEIRALEELNPVGPEGDVLLDPLNMVRIRAFEGEQQAILGEQTVGGEK